MDVTELKLKFCSYLVILPQNYRPSASPKIGQRSPASFRHNNIQKQVFNAVVS
jgi:hypothetical protein